MIMELRGKMTDGLKLKVDEVEDGIKEKVSMKRTTFSDRMLGESRVMLRWRSSLWKLLWKELLIYTLAFLAISFIYRWAMTREQQDQFELLVAWCGKMYTGLPLTFLLGFYVSLVVKRWWEQYCKLPWPDSLALYMQGLVTGEGDEPRLVKRTVIRYCLLSYTLCIRRLSARLRKRFPSMNEVVRTGLARHDEVTKLGDESSSEMYGSNWWLPLQWSTVIISQAQSKGMIKVAPGFNGLLAQIVHFRTALTSVATYGHIPVPLVYTQVVTLAVYVYFAVALVGEQWVIWRKRGSDQKPSGDEVDLYYPVFMTVKFLFFFGWLRVADTLYNPFGEDDDDFELNELLNRHFRVAMRIVDDKEKPPPLKKDAFWAQDEPELEDFPVWSQEYENQVNRDYDTPEGKEREDDTPFDYISVLQQRDPMGHA